MTVSIAELADKVPPSCHARNCKRDRCSVRLDGVCPERLIIDMDCEALGLNNKTRCDYLLVIKSHETTWVVPIEMKGGRVDRIDHVAHQIKEGTRLADSLLPPGLTCQFAPVLAHGKSIHRHNIKRLRRVKIELRGSRKMIGTIKSHCQAGDDDGRIPAPKQRSPSG